MDFVEGLPKSEGYDSLLVMVDWLSKCTHFLPLTHHFTATVVTTIFVKEVIRLHGMPRIVSDRDKVFLSHFWPELFQLQGNYFRRSMAYHPQTDGQTEVVNESGKTYLRCFTYDKPKSWYTWLPWAEHWYNTTFHASKNTTPFYAVYGRDSLP